MFIKISIISLIVAVAATVTQAAEVQWYTVRSCAGGSSVDDQGVGCNVCVDPDGDWLAVEVTGVNSNQAVTAYNEHGCPSGSVVAQQFGNVCIAAGQTALRSVFVAC